MIRLLTLQDAVAYWRQCLNDAPADQPKQITAGWLVGIHLAKDDKLEEWYEEPLFEELLAAAERLEIEPDDSPHIDHDWQEIQRLILELEARYKH